MERPLEKKREKWQLGLKGRCNVGAYRVSVCRVWGPVRFSLSVIIEAYTGTCRSFSHFTLNPKFRGIETIQG